jgi:hypothetical protein
LGFQAPLRLAHCLFPFAECDAQPAPIWARWVIKSTRRNRGDPRFDQRFRGGDIVGKACAYGIRQDEIRTFGVDAGKTNLLQNLQHRLTALGIIPSEFFKI